MDGRSQLKKKCCKCGDPCRLKYCITCRAKVTAAQKEEQNKRRDRRGVPERRSKMISGREFPRETAKEPRRPKNQAPVVKLKLARTSRQWEKIVEAARRVNSRTAIMYEYTPC